MILFFHGADSVRSRREMERAVVEFKRKRDPQGFNIASLDGETVEPQEVVNALATAPFLGEKKMVLVKDIFSDRAAELRSWITEYIARGIPEWLVLLIFESGDVKSKKDPLYIALTKEKYAKEFVLTALSGEQAVAHAFEEHGVSIGADALDAFAGAGIVDPWEHLHTARAIAAYVRGGGRHTVERADIALFLEGAPDDNTFHFIDALVARDARRALTLLHGLWRAGANPHAIFGAILWQWRALLAVAHYHREHPHSPHGEFVRALGIKEFVARKALTAVRSFSFEALRAQFDALVYLDKEVKRGRALAPLLDRFIITVST